MGMTLDVTLILKDFDTLSDFEHRFMDGSIDIEFFPSGGWTDSRAAMIVSKRDKPNAP